jgi:hypothetical protein
MEPTPTIVVKKIIKKKKPVEEKQPDIEPFVPCSVPSAVPSAVPCQKVVKTKIHKAAKKEEPKEEETKQESKEETIRPRPTLVTNLPEFIPILMSFFVKNHKYVGLQETLEGNTIPLFFFVTDEWSSTNELPCTFVNHIETTDDKGFKHVTPNWDDIWTHGDINTNVIWNCMPFDETRDYFYTPTHLKKSSQRTSNEQTHDLLCDDV